MVKEKVTLSYYENGQLALECNYINGNLEGIFKSYYSTGQLYIICNYINGVYDGIYKLYRPNE